MSSTPADAIPSDVIDHLAGIAPGSRLETIRTARPQARASAQESYRLLLHPETPGDVSVEERRIVAAFVAGLHNDAGIRAYYDALLGPAPQRDILQAVIADAVDGVKGPYGHYPSGPLSAEDVDGPAFSLSQAQSEVLGQRLSRALEHAHLLVFHPRDTNPQALQKLLDAGWSTTAIVTLSQLVSFLSFQIRAVIGLRVLASAGH